MSTSGKNDGKYLRNLIGITGALLLGVGMCLTMVWSHMLVGIVVGVIGIIGIVVLLCVLFAVPGMIGWMLPYFVYRRLVQKLAAAAKTYEAAEKVYFD